MKYIHIISETWLKKPQKSANAINQGPSQGRKPVVKHFPGHHGHCSLLPHISKRTLWHAPVLWGMCPEGGEHWMVPESMEVWVINDVRCAWMCMNQTVTAGNVPMHAVVKGHMTRVGAGTHKEEALVVQPHGTRGNRLAKGTITPTHFPSASICLLSTHCVVAMF